MAITLIRRQWGDAWANIKFETKHLPATTTEEAMDVIFATEVDKDLKDLTRPIIFAMDKSEDEFHKNLRISAAKENELITSHCTNPEWNPENYSKNLEDCLKK